MTTKPITIPRNLNPGDVIVDSRGHKSIFKFYDEDMYAFMENGRVYCPDGSRFTPKNPRAVRIIRKRKAKRDKDAEWLRKLSGDIRGSIYLYAVKRMLRIAKRLESK